VADVWLGFKFFKNLDFEFALGGALGGSWEDGLGLEILPRTIAFTPLKISPIGLTEPPCVHVFGLGLGTGFKPCPCLALIEYALL
jgi:hypothetical protein